MKDALPLTGGWTLRLPDSPLGGGRVPAQVPGCVHTDLLAAGLIPDPFLDDNEVGLSWIGRTDWRYDTELAPRTTGHERTDLVFDGLDTVAEIRVGSTVVGTTRNMHRGYRFDVTGLLAADAPTPLSVLFTSAYAEADAVREKLGDRPNSYPEPFHLLRKMACNFGWDWGPTLVTAGIWRQARVEHWSTARLARVTPQVTVEDGTGRVRLDLDLERTPGGEGRRLTVLARVGAARAAEAHAESTADGANAETTTAEARAETTADGAAASLTVEVPDPELWWPRGYGQQPLYDCEITLLDGDRELDRWTRRVGFRTVALDTGADEHGSAFTLVVNGEPVFARGVNWIPDDALVTRVTAERYRTRLRQAADAGVDLVRVWGGGIYESEDFYDACDELGLLVWQDFLFACAAYPEEQPLRGEVEAEARENVTRLAPHPSLVLWNGNNENLWAFRDWGWEGELAGDSWGEGYYLGLLPRVVAETDPTRPYWAGSPWSGSWDHHPNDPDHGTAHSWDVWNRLDHTEYRTQIPRFLAEFGFQAPPAYATLRRALSDTPLAPDSPGMLHHQKAGDGNGKLARGLAHHFNEAVDFDAWHYLTQVNQARAIATGIEHWRSHWPRCAGTVVWQLNDCWPVTSWAAIDGDGHLKPLYHELRRLYADRLLTVQPRDGGLVAAVVNQSAEPWTGHAVLRRIAVDGTVLAQERLPFGCAARAVATLPVPGSAAPAEGSAKELLVVEADGTRAFWFPARDKDFAYPVPRWDLSVATTGAGAEVTVTARTLVRDLLLQADRLAPGARTDTGLVTLLPGESATIAVHDWAADGSPEAAVEKALFCVNSAQKTIG
ncbi:glycoside hydrolase family 2 protein [Streptomyces pathocidini]|uniref:glycoside hydrolase family 2 protein n=1 Tax=Streptomyces pathocidini TaxID=1650571 RepID=UPI0033E49DDE